MLTKNLEAIAVYNVPHIEFESHLKLLYEIIYFSKENITYNQSLDIVFYDEASPRAMLIGGTNQEEFLALNNSIGNNITKDISDQKGYQNNEKSPIKTSSPLTYEIVTNDKKHSILLPFELFKILDAENPDNFYDIFEDMVINFLNQNAIKDIKIDTQRGYYIDKYYQFKMLFQNSIWTKRIAFKLACQLRGRKIDYIVGTDKYTAQIISMLKSYEDFSNYIYEVVNPAIDYLPEHWEHLKDKNMLTLSSVIFDGRFTQDKIYSKIKSQNKEWYSIVGINGQSTITNSLFVLPVKAKESSKDFFEANLKKPLYGLGLDDSFEIDDFYLDDYKPKSFKSYTEDKEFIPRWIGSAYFGHVRRGNNHYAFYTKTIQFYKDNVADIKKFLEDIKNETQLREKTFIIAPLHHTNNNFVTAVNNIVFENDATVISLDKNKGEANYHISCPDIERYKNGSAVKIYFVDDEIASASTLQYYYLWMQRYFGQQKSFDGIITLIDRCSPESEMIIGHYLADHNNKSFHAFTTLQIKPIKSIGGEQCFLCKREKEYETLLELSALDLTRFKFADKIYKLKLKKPKI